MGVSRLLPAPRLGECRPPALQKIDVQILWYTAAQTNLFARPAHCSLQAGEPLHCIVVHCGSSRISRHQHLFPRITGDLMFGPNPCDFGEIDPIHEDGLPCWAKPWRWDPAIRRQQKTDRRDYKQELEEAGLSDESDDPMESTLSSLTAESASPVLELSDEGFPVDEVFGHFKFTPVHW